MTLLVVTAVTQERDAILAACPGATVLVAGVGPATAAAATSAELAINSYDLVLCAGIGGGFGPLDLGDIAVASSCVFADLGVRTDERFTPLPDVGFGVNRYDVAPRLAVELADLTGGHLGAILTVATVTGTAAGADEMQDRIADAVAEGMEGAAVAAAATHHNVAFAEIRAISNVVGPRDRDAWDIDGALAALGRAVAAVAATRMAS